MPHRLSPDGSFFENRLDRWANMLSQTTRLIFDKFRELGSGPQVFPWLRIADIFLPVVQRDGALWNNVAEVSS